jgi:hypothetical protein
LNIGEDSLYVAIVYPDVDDLTFLRFLREVLETVHLIRAVYLEAGVEEELDETFGADSVRYIKARALLVSAGFSNEEIEGMAKDQRLRHNRQVAKEKAHQMHEAGATQEEFLAANDTELPLWDWRAAWEKEVSIADLTAKRKRKRRPAS